MLFLLVALTSTCASAQESGSEPPDPEKTAGELMTAETDASIELGLTWLVERQHDDGSFGLSAYRGNAAVTALAGMAMLAAGSTPGRGPHGERIDRAIDYLIEQTQPSGFIAPQQGASHGPMYGHGFATLFLAECYGMSNRAELREKLSAAVKLIVNTQNDEGGWRYQPRRGDADLSVTICQVMALRAARNAGLHVPNKTIDRSVEYVTESQNADGGFMYMLSQTGPSDFPRSAAGLVTLYSAGVYEGDEVERATEYLMQFLPDGKRRREQAYYYYGHYYAIQAMWIVGGDAWARWYPAVRDEMIEAQEDDGSWQSQIVCREYATAMALVVLQLPENCLPIFQR